MRPLITFLICQQLSQEKMILLSAIVGTRQGVYFQDGRRLGVRRVPL
jgi:hypothetical protein